MKLLLNRVKDDSKTTIGCLFVNKELECFTVEDTSRELKVAGETCVPAGEYEIKLRNAGGMTKKYSKRYPFHEGMLWLQDVPGFEWIYIHVGNTSEHTEGCILVNGTCDSVNMVGGNSRTVYVKLYKSILTAIKKGERVTINIV